MQRDIGTTIRRLDAAANAVGRNGLHARAAGRPSIRGDIEALAVAPGEESEDSGLATPSRLRQRSELALSGYRLARGLLGAVPEGWVLSGDDVVDLVEGRVGFGQLPAELVEEADLLIAEQGGHPLAGDLWDAFEIGVLVAVLAATISYPDLPNAA